MANPGKQYKLPDQLIFTFGMAGKYLAMVDAIKIGAKTFQINAVPIDIEGDDSYEQFLFEQECGSGDDY